MEWQGQRPESSGLRNEAGGEATEWYHSFKKYGHKKKQRNKKRLKGYWGKEWSGKAWVSNENFFKVEKPS